MGIITGFLSRRGISSHTCLSCPAENIVFAVCASKMALIFLHHGGPRKHLSGPLGQPDTLQLPQPIIIKPRGHPGSEAFYHYAQILRLLGLWKHSQNVFLCNRDACLENPGCKHFSLPGGYTQLFCEILRHKRDIPS